MGVSRSGVGIGSSTILTLIPGQMSSKSVLLLVRVQNHFRQHPCLQTLDVAAFFTVQSGGHRQGALLAVDAEPGSRLLRLSGASKESPTAEASDTTVVLDELLTGLGVFTADETDGHPVVDLRHKS